MKPVIDLEQHALTRLGTVAEERYKIYSGRIYRNVDQIRTVVNRYNHLIRIVNLFESSATDRAGKGAA